MEEHYSSMKERLRSRSPLTKKLNESSEVVLNKSAMSRNFPAAKLAAHYTTSKMSRQPPAYSTHVKTLSTKAASVSRQSNIVLPNLGTAMSRQPPPLQSRRGNAQSALTLNQETEGGDYPYANLAARRKLLRMQHLMGKADSQWTKTADGALRNNNHSQ